MRSYAVKQFTAPLEAVEVTTPVLKGTEVLIDVHRCGVCHTDLHIQDGYYDLGGGNKLRLVDRGIHPPVVMGHEALGKIVAKGPDADVPDDLIGRNLLVYPWLGCGECGNCISGNDHLCAKPSSIGVFRPGGYADQCVVPHPRYLIDVTGIEPSLAATYACSGLTAYSALKKVNIDRERDRLLIIGAGGVGMSCLSIARALGFKRIAVGDIDPAKRDLALSFGADSFIDPRDEGQVAGLASAPGGLAAAIDFVASELTATRVVAALRKGGTYVAVGLFGGGLTVPLPSLVQRALTLRGSYVGSLNELHELIELVGTGEIYPIPVETVAFDDVNSALTRLRNGKVKGRLVLSR